MPMRPRSGRRQAVRQRKSCSGLLEAENLASLRVDSGHNMPDDAVLAGRVHALKNQQERVTVGCVMKLLKCAEFLHMFFKQLLILLLRMGQFRGNRRPPAQVKLFARRRAVILRIYFHPVLAIQPMGQAMI